jgi:hypothetical protein
MRYGKSDWSKRDYLVLAIFIVAGFVLLALMLIPAIE